jgi:hypothetical protein
MHIIGQHSFVIETRLPKGPGLNEVRDGLVVPVEEPEYEYMWFAGVGLHPEMAAKGQILFMNIWTPYPEQAARYKDKDEADAVNDKILTKVAGGYVIDYELSHWREGRQVVVPVFGTIQGGKSNAGIDERGRLK